MIQTSVFKKKNFFLLMGYQLSSGLAYKMFQFCIPWLIYSLTGSGSKMAIGFGVSMAPYLIFTLLGGSLIDYFNKRKVLLAITSLSCLTLLVFSICMFANVVSVNFQGLYLLSFLLATYNAVDLAAFDASTIDYFNKDEFVSINTGFEVILNFINIIGPLIAGVMIAYLGSLHIMSIIALLYFTSFILVKFSKPLREAPICKEVKSIGQLIYENGQLIKEGATYVFRPGCPLLLSIMMACLSNLVFGSKDTLFLYLARDSFNIGSERFASIISVVTIVSITTIAVLPNYLKKVNKIKIMICILFLDAIFSLIIGVSNSKAVLFEIYGITVVTESLYNVFSKTFRQYYVPPHMIGRVAGITRSLSYSSIALSGVISGIALGVMNVQTFFLIGGCIMAVVGILSYGFQKLYPPIVFQDN